MHQRADGKSTNNKGNKLSNPVLTTETSESVIGRNETIRCISANGSLPITYTLFLNKTSIGNITVSERKNATFYVIIHHNSTGPYMCEANNTANKTKKSNTFNFVLKDELSNPVLTTETSESVTGRNETIRCISANGFLPITYTLFLNKTSKGVITLSQRQNATFYVIIHQNSTGPYQCKAKAANKTKKSNTFNFVLKDEVSNPVLTTETSESVTGRNETIRCISANGSLPITYTLFLHQTRKGDITVSEHKEATFYVIINHNSTGPYKCKANNTVKNDKYSKQFDFVLKEYLVNTSIISKSSVTAEGLKENLHCVSAQGSLPITYVLLRNGSDLGNITVTENKQAVFNINIANTQSLGPYRCRANNSVTNESLSEEFSFTFQGAVSSKVLILCILLPIFLIALILTTCLLIYKSRKGPIGILSINKMYEVQPAKETGTTDSMQERVYADIRPEEIDMEKQPEENYSIILFSENTGDKIVKNEDSVEYTEILVRGNNS
ncbi:allergin-1 isoform X2 [Bombina bombina]|uniref:allergin-1 isoform X2 n=1 Tax=Bombina bombina TaxID=8345 RepID=UPI00235B2C96|nr:allergin-1 isoform X2 [Bombina bombina]